MPNKQEDSGFVTSALNWMYENEMVDQTPVLNNLYGNIYSMSKQIKDVELLINKNTRKMMVYLKLGIFGKLFKTKLKRDIAEGILEVLPKFKIRITLDKTLFDKAYKILTSQVGDYQEDKEKEKFIEDTKKAVSKATKELIKNVEAEEEK